jgi:hypothetical protein
MIATYQPFRCVDDPHFRAMCQSLNPKDPILSREKLKSLVSEEFYIAQVKGAENLEGKVLCFYY